MKSFINKTADYIINHFLEEIDGLCVVFPNRRAGLFLKKSLAVQAGKTIWSPQIYSLEDFIISLSGFKIIDPVYLQFELYKVHREIEKNQAQSFEEFINWGRVLLNDFNEMDKYLVDVAQLFGYLSDEKALMLWNPENTVLSEFQVRYLRFYQSLKLYYDRLTTEIINRNEVYQGLAYRKVAQKIDVIQNQLPFKKIIFAGFNALTTAEKQIIFSLEKSRKALLLWDADKYFIDDETQESGKFIRSFYHQSDKEQFHWIENSFKESTKEITLIGVPQMVGQAKVAGQLLKELSDDKNDLDQTVVVLNDTSIIEPLLNSIPHEVGKFNLTMGLPLKSTPVFRLFDSIFELQTNIIKFDRSGGKSPKIYFRDLLRLFNHPYVLHLLFKNNLGEVPVKIRTSNRVFLDYNELLEGHFKEEGSVRRLISAIAKPWEENPVTALESLLHVINALKLFYITPEKIENSIKEKHDLELEYLFHFHKIFQKLSNLLKDYPYIENLKVFRSLFAQLADVTLPFYGEPLHGLQVMGMLETQTLDFKNVILLGTNEDFLPAGKSSNSFIPYEIRRKFLLPTYHDSNAVYAYHFYRLVQRAKKVIIQYNSEPGELGGGDRSRFIAQLQYELPKYNCNIHIHERILSIPIIADKVEDKIDIVKTKEILDQLRDHSEYGFSASSLNSYRTCPLQFYFKYIARVDEVDEPEETIEASTLGSVVHEVLAKLFEPLRGMEILMEDIEMMKLQTESFVGKAFENNFPDGDINFGKNLLIVKVANQYVINFLEREIQFLRNTKSDGGYLMIRELEKTFSAMLLIEVENKGFEVKLTGRFDRIDENSGTVRIIDYKTGKVDAKDLKLKSWEDLLTESKLDKCFQLLLYAYIYRNQDPHKLTPIIPGIISFRSLSSGMMNISLPENELLSQAAMVRFESVLKSIITDVFNPDLPFYQTEITENCRYCKFIQTCNRN